MNSDGFAANIQLVDEMGRIGRLVSPINQTRKSGLTGTASGAKR